MTLQKKQRFPLNIQLFAENNGTDNGNGGTPPDVKNSPEYLALKAQLDSTSSELSKMKKAQKDTLPEVERLKNDYNEMKVQKEQVEQELLHSKISAKFGSAGFDEKEISKFIDSYKNGDILSFLGEVISAYEKKVETIKNAEKEKFMKSQTVPGGGNSGNDRNPSDDAIIKATLDSYNQKSNSPLSQYNKYRK